MASDPLRFRSVRSWVARVARRSGFPETSVYELTVAVAEACSNAHRHAYDGRTDGEIEFEIAAGAHGLTLRIRDWGRGFDPSDWRPPRLDDPAEGGYGIYLIRRLVDEVAFAPASPGTRIVLTKYLQRPEQGAEG